MRAGGLFSFGGYTMLGPYRIERQPAAQGYTFKLMNEVGSVVIEVQSNSPLPPPVLLNRQAILNTSAVLDRLGVHF